MSVRTVFYDEERSLDEDPFAPLGVSLALMLGAVVLVSPFLPGKAETITGEVSDAMCGAKHMMEGSAAECTRACVCKGSKYALVSGDKVYTLDTTTRLPWLSWTNWQAKRPRSAARWTGTRSR